MTGVEQLKSGANCLIPDGNTFQLFHTSQIMDPADKKILNRSNMVSLLKMLLLPYSCSLLEIPVFFIEHNPASQSWARVCVDSGRRDSLIKCDR